MRHLAEIHTNPRFTKIHLHTFRHCNALREYHKTQNMQHVKRFLGHRSIMTTQRYVELYEDLYANQERETITEIALKIQEAKNSKTEDSSMNVASSKMAVCFSGDKSKLKEWSLSKVICDSLLKW